MFFVPDATSLRAGTARDPRQLAAAYVAAVIAVVVIGLVDFFTGPLWEMSAFYLIPVAGITMVAGRRGGYALAALSCIAGMLSDVVFQAGHRDVAAWNVAFMVETLIIVVELVARLQQRAVEAREAERRGREFLAYAAHQLRTPIAAIRSTVEALVVSGQEERDQLLTSIARESARAGRLVNSLLRVARLDQHEALPRVRTDVVGVVDAEVQRAQAAAPSLAWQLDAPDGGVVTIGDPESLAEAMAAVLDNARRHARTRVAVSVRPLGDEVEVAVSDDGPGLPAGSGESAFDRFVSLDGRGGTGLGLPIARGIAEAHGGTLTYEDKAFVVRLPAPAPSEAAPGAWPQHPAITGRSG
jgi:signal transduction histidine kinase